MKSYKILLHTFYLRELRRLILTWSTTQRNVNDKIYEFCEGKEEYDFLNGAKHINPVMYNGFEKHLFTRYAQNEK